MKRFIFSLTLITSLFAFSSSSSLAHTQLNQFFLKNTIQSINPFDVINWTLGDKMEYQISAAFGNIGTMEKEVTEDNADTLWLTQSTKLMNQNDIVEILLNKADGKVLKIIRNGKEERIPESDLEIIDQDYTTVTVPAGTFESLHVTANTKDVSNLEVWINPDATVMDGVLKNVIPTNMLTLTMELTAFKHGKP